MRSGLASIVLVALAVSGCAGDARYLHPFYDDDPRPIGCSSDSRDAVTITYLGTAGMLIERGKDAIMTAPFFSNPGMLQVALLPISTDPKRVEKGLQRVDLSGVRAILVGHAHYDHLMDAIWVAQNKACGAKLYGSDTMKNIACSGLPNDRLISLEASAGDWWKEGQWETVIPGRVRIMAIRSEHAPHVGCLKLFGGKVEDCCCRRPRTAWGWKEGQTLGFLVDFLDGFDAAGKPKIALRLYAQDSAANPPYGFPPTATLAEHRVDVLIPCVASFENVQGYPEELVRHVNPRHVVLSHWDNFFTAQSSRPSVVPLLDTQTFATRLTEALPAGAQWHTPGVRQTLKLCLD